MSNKGRFWADAFSEPKRQYRYVLSNMRGIPQWIIKTVKKPSLQISETQHQFINYTFYYPGRVEWQPIDITLVDPVDPDATATLMEIVRDMGYVYPSDIDTTGGGVITISKKKSIEALGREIYIDQIDPDGGGKIETWVLKNPFITNLDFGELSYESDELVNINMTLRHDYARCLLKPTTGADLLSPTPADRLPEDMASPIAGGGRVNDS